MFERVHLVLQNLEPNESVNENVVRIIHIIENNNMNSMTFFLEVMLYIVYSTITGWYNYTLWSLEKPVHTLVNLYYVYKDIVSRTDEDRNIKCNIYKRLLLTLIFDIIRFVIMFFIYYSLQIRLMWK